MLQLSIQTSYTILMETDHKYLRKVDCSKHISLKKSTLIRVLVAGTNYYTKIGQAGRQGRQARSMTVNISALATNRTNIFQTGITHHINRSSLMRCLWNRQDSLKK